MRLQWERLNAVSSQAVSQKLCQKMQNMAEQSVIIHKYVQGQNTLLLLFIWLCWEQYLTIKFTSSTCIFKELPSLSFTQQLSIWSRTRTTSSVATLLLLLCNFLEWFHWGVHRKKKKWISQNMSCVVILLWKKHALAGLEVWFRITSGFLQLKGFVY